MSLTSAALLLSTCASLAIVALRVWLADAWRRSLMAVELLLPTSLTVDQVATWLSAQAAVSHPARFSVVPLRPVGLEVVATREGVRHFLLVAREDRGAVLTALRGAASGVGLRDAPEYTSESFAIRLAGELTITSRRRVLAVDRAAASSRGLLAALQPVPHGCSLRVQWLLTSAGTPRPVPSTKPKDAPGWVGELLGQAEAADSEAVRSERLKYREPLLRAVCRVGVAAPSTAAARSLFGRVWAPLHLLNAPGVRLRRRLLPSWLIAVSMRLRWLPVFGWPLLLNAKEAAGLLPLAAGDQPLPGMRQTVARSLPPAPHIPTTGTVLAVSNYPGLDRPLALREADRLRHTWAVGPTGSGKSWLLASMALQDIARGRSVVIVDIKNDLVDDVLARIPDRRLSDVVVVDPADIERPIGFNVLAGGRGELAREQSVDHVLHIFAELWHNAWGVRTADVLRNACLALTHATPPDNSVFTLAELPELLTNPNFRRQVLAQAAVPASTRGFWQQYEALSDAERAQWIGPSLNKLRQLTTRTPLRLTLGQSSGLDLTRVLSRPTVLCLRLSPGTVGEATADLIGALFLGALWQAVLSRTAVPPARRRPVHVYLDEFARLLRLPLSFADMLSLSRALGVSFNLANQYVYQLTEAARGAVVGTVRTHVTFQTDRDDARLLAPRFTPLTPEDLTGLGPFEVAIRPCVDGQTLPPVTGRTQPLPPALRDPDDVVRLSRERFGTPREDVEAALAARIDTPTPDIGRRRRGAP